MNDLHNQRDLIIWGEKIDWDNRGLPGLSVRIDNLTVDQMKKLIEIGFMQVQRTMNSSPSVGEFLKFGEDMKSRGYEFRYEAFTHNPVFDADVHIEGIVFEGEYPDGIGLDFVKFVSPYSPDELKVGPRMLRAWWD